jgi:hypothetical protein
MDNEIKMRLVESGWAEADVDRAFGMLKQTAGPAASPIGQISGDAGATSRYDLGLPSKSEVKVEPESTEVKSGIVEKVWAPQAAPTAVEVKKKGGWKTGLLVGLMLLGIGGIAVGIWILAKSIAGRIGQPKLEMPVTSSKIKVPSPTSGLATGSGLTVVGGLAPTPFVSSKAGFKFSLPKGWKADESGSFGTLVSVANPESDVDGENKFAANINIVTEAALEVTLDEYLSASKEVLKKSFTDYNLIAERNVDVGGKAGGLLEASYNMGVYPLRNMQLIVVDNGKAYVLTATTLNSTWDKYKDVFEGSLLSFTLR